MLHQILANLDWHANETEGHGDTEIYKITLLTTTVNYLH